MVVSNEKYYNNNKSSKPEGPKAKKYITWCHHIIMVVGLLLAGNSPAAQRSVITVV